jgi:hypothetical protein
MALQQMVMQPSPLGELFTSMADIPGPAAYVGGTPYVLSANAFALQTFKFATGGLAQSGTYGVEVTSIAGPGAATVKLRFFLTTTGAELGAGPTNLSAETFRILALGN